MLQDCQMETLKLVSKARVTRRGYLGVGYRFLQVDTIRNRIRCPLIDHALSARVLTIDLLAQHISLVGFFLAKFVPGCYPWGLRMSGYALKRVKPVLPSLILF